jgi:hypothetical protein
LQLRHTRISTNLACRKYIQSTNDAAAKKIAARSGATRDELVKAAESAYAAASASGGAAATSASSYLAQATEAAKKSAFDNWSESELKAYLDSYGIPVHQGSTINELRALARRQYTYFKYGTTTPSGTVLAKLGESFNAGLDWIKEQVGIGANVAKKQADAAHKKVKSEL